MKRFFQVVALLTCSLAGHAAHFGVGVGEIPLLANSFKPSFSASVRLSEFVQIKGVIQGQDHLERDQDSMNAESIPLDGLQSSKEVTGVRGLISANWFPFKTGLYLQAGMVYNGDDTETVVYDNRQRQIGSNIYSGDLSVEIKKSADFLPSIGLGYRYEIGLWGVDAGFSMAVFHEVQKPKIDILSSEQIVKSDENALKKQITESYQDNFHNHIHIFYIHLTHQF